MAGIIARTQVAMMARDAEQVRGWEAALSDLAAEAAALKAEGRWRSGPQTLLEMFGLHRDERKLVACLEWLLSPDGHHGLGNRVVVGLLDLLNVSYTSTDLVKVRREVSRLDHDGTVTRADLVLHVGTRCVLIEAKVEAAEHRAQCDRLARLWAHEDPLLLFLTRDGRAPTDAPESRDRWKPLAWAQITDIIARATDPDLITRVEDQHRASPGAQEVLQTLRTFHSGRRSHASVDDKTRFYLRHWELIEEWHALQDKTTTAIRAAILQAFGRPLAAFGADQRWEGGGPDGAYPTFQLRRPGWPYEIAVALQWKRDEILRSGQTPWPYAGIRVAAGAVGDRRVRRLKDELAPYAAQLEWHKTDFDKKTGRWMWWRLVQPDSDDPATLTTACREALEQGWSTLSGPLDSLLGAQ